MATNNNVSHTDTASGKGGGALTQDPEPTSNPGANPGDLATQQGSGNAKSREAGGDAAQDPEDAAGRMGSTGRDTSNA